MRPFRFVPYDELGDTPNVIVDGSPTPSTRLTLSHWPGSPTPEALLDDLSAQIAFHALDHPDVLADLEVVSNNHLDQDGLASAYALVAPAEADARRERVIDVARAGDFGWWEDRDSMRIAIAVAALDDLGYAELLGRFTEMLDRPQSLRALWEDEDAHLQEGLDAISTGVVGVVEHADVDLAVVTVPEEWAERTATRFTMSRQAALHPCAVNQSTQRLRVAVLQGRRYRVEMRYESWVMFRSRPVLPRPDLRVLAAQLTQDEGGAVWQADPPGALTPTLAVMEGETALAPEQFVERLTGFLRTAPPAWDPFAR